MSDKLIWGLIGGSVALGFGLDDIQANKPGPREEPRHEPGRGVRRLLCMPVVRV